MYDRFIRAVEQWMRSEPHHRWQQWVEKVKDWWYHERDPVIMAYTRSKHPGWDVLFSIGAPTFYELLGCETDASFEDLYEGLETKRTRHRAHRHLFEAIFATLANDQTRWEYDFQNSEFYWKSRGMGWKLKESRDAFGFWKRRDDILRALILRPEVTLKGLERWCEIINQSPDWEDFLPRKRKTMYSVFGLDRDALPEEPRAIDRHLRKQYRRLDRTEDINRIYTVLKNPKLRADYDWMLEHHAFYKKLSEMMSRSNIKSFDSATTTLLKKLMELLDEEESDELFEPRLFFGDEIDEIDEEEDASPSLFERALIDKLKETFDTPPPVTEQMDKYPEVEAEDHELVGELQPYMSRSERGRIERSTATMAAEHEHEYEPFLERSKYTVFKCTICGATDKRWK